MCLSCTTATTVLQYAGKTTSALKDNCKTCTFDATLAATCTDCTGAYVWSATDTACVLCDPNCTAKKCDVAGSLKCNDGKCVAGYGTSSGTCAKCGVNCAECYAAAGTCEKCNSGYKVKTDNKDCAMCISNCDFCTNGATCDTGRCASGYFFKSATSCLACYSITNCKSCTSPDLWNCTPKDGWGFYFAGKDAKITQALAVTGAIKACIDNCAECSGTNTYADCIAAKDGFFKDSVTKTIVACVKGCAKCTGATVALCSASLPGMY